MNWQEIKITSWEHFNREVERFKNHNSYLSELWFRGQSNSNWKLQTSIHRIAERYNLNKKKTEGFEQTMFREFTSKAHTYADLKNGQFEMGDEVVWWSIMQHYGCPTRLLDWTESPYVALYFAIDGNWDQDGVVYVFHQAFHGDVNKRHNPIPKEDIFKYPDKNIVLPILINFHSSRSIAQQGTFTFSPNILLDHETGIYMTYQLEPSDKVHCWKYTIPSNLKIEFLSRLRTLNVSANSLFPDLYGFSKSLRDLLEIRGWQQGHK